MRQMLRLAPLVAALATTNGCLRQTAFRCADNADCGTEGACESIGYCSFADGSCPDGRRYGDLSGTNAGQCVGATGDAGVDGPLDAPIDAPIDARIDAPACPAGYVSMGTSSYRYVSTLVTWAAAEADCADDGFGTHLVVAADTGEVTIVDTISTASRTWIGLTDLRIPDLWRWVTGAVGPTLLLGGNSPGDCGQHYDVATDLPKRLQNRNCAQTAAYLCECDGVAPDPNAF